MCCHVKPFTFSSSRVIKIDNIQSVSIICLRIIVKINMYRLLDNTKTYDLRYIKDQSFVPLGY